MNKKEFELEHMAAQDEEMCAAIITECSLHSEDLTEFYRKRLEPAHG